MERKSRLKIKWGPWEPDKLIGDGARVRSGIAIRGLPIQVGQLFTQQDYSRRKS